MSDKLKELVREAVYRLSQSGSDDLLLAINIDLELEKHKTFMDYLTEETV